MEMGICVVGIVVDHRKAHAKDVQEVLSQYSSVILNRNGIPHPDQPEQGIITLTLRCNTEEKEKLERELNQIPDVCTQCMRLT